MTFTEFVTEYRDADGDAGGDVENGGGSDQRPSGSG